MLTTCKECSGVVSSLRESCPHCGYPLKTRRTRRKLPNGFGQISKIKGKNLANPYRRMVTVEEGGIKRSKILKPKGYFATYNDRYQALMEYNRDPGSIASITMEELFNRWSREHFKTVSVGTVANIERNWRYCHKIYSVDPRDLKRRDVKELIDTCSKEVNGKILTPSNITKRQIKTVLSQVLDYGIEQDIIERNVVKAVNLRLPQEQPSEIHTAFSEEELMELWNKDRNIYEDMVLVQCYSGWRPGELLELKCENIMLDEMSFFGGSKTAAGKDRIVPIHKRIVPIVQKYYDKYNTYLFSVSGKQIQYYTFRLRFQDLFPNHYPHDGRKTFVTRAKEYNVDEYAIKRIAGHAITDITEKTYTERSLDWLKAEIEKIE